MSRRGLPLMRARRRSRMPVPPSQAARRGPPPHFNVHHCFDVFRDAVCAAVTGAATIRRHSELLPLSPGNESPPLTAESLSQLHAHIEHLERETQLLRSDLTDTLERSDERILVAFGALMGQLDVIQANQTVHRARTEAPPTDPPESSSERRPTFEDICTQLKQLTAKIAEFSEDLVRWMNDSSVSAATTLVQQFQATVSKLCTRTSSVLSAAAAAFSSAASRSVSRPSIADKVVFGAAGVNSAAFVVGLACPSAFAVALAVQVVAVAAVPLHHTFL